MDSGPGCQAAALNITLIFNRYIYMYIYIYAISRVNLFITQTNSYQILSSYDIITYDVVYCSCHDDTELLKDIDIYIYIHINTVD